jgi:hypothetical protein
LASTQTSDTCVSGRFAPSGCQRFAIVERHVEPVLRAREEQAFLHGVLADDVAVVVGGDAVDDLRPVRP